MPSHLNRILTRGFLGYRSHHRLGRSEKEKYMAIKGNEHLFWTLEGFPEPSRRAGKAAAEFIRLYDRRGEFTDLRENLLDGLFLDLFSNSVTGDDDVWAVVNPYRWAVSKVSKRFPKSFARFMNKACA